MLMIVKLVVGGGDGCWVGSRAVNVGFYAGLFFERVAVLDEDSEFVMKTGSAYCYAVEILIVFYGLKKEYLFSSYFSRAICMFCFFVFDIVNVFVCFFNVFVCFFMFFSK